MKLLYLLENIFVPAVKGKTGGMEGGEDGGRGKWEKFLAIKSSPLAGSDGGSEQGRRGCGAGEKLRCVQGRGGGREGGNKDGRDKGRDEEMERKRKGG
jgi:hypothetical protein